MKNFFLTCTYVSLFALFSQPASGEECSRLFNELNGTHSVIEQSYTGSIPDGETMRLLTALETELFAAIAKCPQHADIFTLMGEVQISLGQISLAVAYGIKAVELDEESWRAQSLLGSTLTMTGKAELGVKHLAKAVELQPDNERLQLNYGGALVQADMLDKAMKICKNLTTSRDKLVAGTAHNMCGQIYVRKGDLRNAGKSFDEARKLGIDPRRQMIDPEDIKRQLDQELQIEGTKKSALRIFSRPNWIISDTGIAPDQPSYPPLTTRESINGAVVLPAVRPGL